jgi:CRP-like cAMP-binding protein
MRVASREERFAALRAVRELATCSDDEVRSLLAYAEEAQLFAGERIAHEGRLCTELMVVIDGTLRMRSLLIGPGGSCGWDSMWERSANRATVVAESDARVLVMSHAQFRAVKAIVGRDALRTCVPDEARAQIVA